MGWRDQSTLLEDAPAQGGAPRWRAGSTPLDTAPPLRPEPPAPQQPAQPAPVAREPERPVAQPALPKPAPLATSQPPAPPAPPPEPLPDKEVWYDNDTKIAVFPADTPDERIERVLAKETADKRDLTWKQAAGRSLHIDSEKHTKRRQTTKIGKTARAEYAELFSTDDVEVKPENITQPLLEAAVKMRKAFAEKAAQEPHDPVALREYIEDTAAMELDLKRGWVGEATSKSSQGKAEKDTLTGDAIRLAMDIHERGVLAVAGDAALRTARDTGVMALKGAVGLPQAMTGLADMIPITAAMPGGMPGGPLAKIAEAAGIPLYGWSGWMQEKMGVDYEGTQQILHEAYSPETQQAYTNVSEAEGLLGKIGAALTNPSVVLTSVGESVPQMLAGGAMGKAPALGKYGYAVGEGLISAGAGAEQTRAQSEDGFLTEGQVAIHGASGALTGVIGALGGKVAARLGIDDIDVLLAGGASQKAQRNVVIRAVAGAISEATEEAPQSVQEQIASNLAQGKKWHEGWDESLVVGALSGAVMGGAIQVRPRAQSLERLEAIRAKGWVTVEEGEEAGLSEEELKNRATRDAAIAERIQKAEQEIQDAETVQRPEAEVREDEGGPPVHRPGKVKVPAKPAGEVAPAPEVPVEEAGTEPLQEYADRLTGLPEAIIRDTPVHRVRKSQAADESDERAEAAAMYDHRTGTLHVMDEGSPEFQRELEGEVIAAWAWKHLTPEQYAEWRKAVGYPVSDDVKGGVGGGMSNVDTFAHSVQDWRAGKQWGNSGPFLEKLFGEAQPAAPESPTEATQPKQAPEPVSPAETTPESPWAAETRQRLEAVPAFKGSAVELDETAGTAKVTRPDGRATTVHLNDDAKLTALAQKRGVKRVKGAYIYKTGKKGKFQEGDIYIRSDAGHDTLNHEAIHWLEDEGVITPEEVAQYGDREGLAGKYGKWAASKQRKSNPVFQRIYDFLEPIFSSQARLFQDIGKRGTQQEAAPKPKIGRRGVTKKAPPVSEGPAPKADAQERWDSAKLGKRVEWAMRSGFVTKAGKLTKRGEVLANARWLDLSPAAQNVIHKEVAKDYPAVEEQEALPLVSKPVAPEEEAAHKKALQATGKKVLSRLGMKSIPKGRFTETVRKMEEYYIKKYGVRFKTEFVKAFGPPSGIKGFEVAPSSNEIWEGTWPEKYTDIEKLGLLRHELEHILDRERGFEAVGPSAGLYEQLRAQGLSHEDAVTKTFAGHHQYYRAFEFDYPEGKTQEPPVSKPVAPEETTATPPTDPLVDLTRRFLADESGMSTQPLIDVVDKLKRDQPLTDIEIGALLQIDKVGRLGAEHAQRLAKAMGFDRNAKAKRVLEAARGDISLEGMSYRDLKTLAKQMGATTQEARTKAGAREFIESKQAEIAERYSIEPVSKVAPEGTETAKRRIGARRKRPRPPISRDTVQQTFPGAKVTKAPGGWHVEVGDSFFTIQVTDEMPEIDWDAAEQSIGRRITDADREQIQAAGATSLTFPDGTKHDGLGLILLNEALADDAVLRHEALHLARQAGIIGQAEWDALVKAHARGATDVNVQEERIAQTMEAVEADTKLWSRIQSWIRRLLAKLGITDYQVRDIHQLLRSSGFWARAGQVAEQQPRYALRGRPDLANPATKEESRRVVDDVDEARNQRGLPERRADKDVEREANERLERDYEGERDNLIQAGRNGEQLLDVDTIIAKKIVNREASEAMQSGDPQRIADTMAIIESYRNTGSEQGRAFRQRQDPVETPAERMARAISEAILEPPTKERERRNKARRKGRHGEADRINEQWAKRFQELKDKLKTLGVDLDNPWEHGYSRKRAATILATIEHAKATTSDKFYEYWRNSILSLPTTQMANVFGNVGHAAWHFTAERCVEALVNKVARRPEGAQLGEFKHMLAGMLPGMSEGARNFLTSWNTESPAFEASIGREGQWRIEDPHTAIGGKVGKVIRWPQRLLLAVDDFSKTIFTRMEVGTNAYRIAKAEGLSGEAMAKRMQELTLNEESQAWDAAYDSALDLTFQQKGGEQLQAVKESVLGFRGKVWGVRYLLPFVTTPANIFATGVKKSPLGTLGLSTKMYRNYRAGRHVLHGLPADAAQQVLAWALVLALLSNDDEDPWITGGEPASTYEKREVSYRTTPAMSVKFGGDWHSYSRLEPFATTIALTVDFVNGIRSGDPKRMVEAPMDSLFGQLQDKTFLRGMADMVAITQSPDKGEAIAKWAQNFTTSWVPNIVRGVGREESDYYENRRVWGTRSDWFKRLGKRTLQKTELAWFQEYPIYDAWGRPATRSETGLGPATDWLYRITIPIRIQEDQAFTADRLILNYNLQNPEDERFPLAPRPSYTDTKGKTQYTTDGQYAELTRLSGETARAALDETPFDTDKPTLEAVEWINEAATEARAAVRERLIKRWDGETVEIDPVELGKEIRKDMRESLAYSVPRFAPKRKPDMTDKEHANAVENFKEKLAKVNRTLDTLGVTHEEAETLLRESFHEYDDKGKLVATEKVKSGGGNLKPSYLDKRNTLAELYGKPLPYPTLKR